MTPDQKKLFDSIVKRWHTKSPDGLTLIQACMDIGSLCGLISILDPECFKKEDVPMPQFDGIHDRMTIWKRKGVKP